MIQSNTIQSIPQPSAVPYWNMKKTKSMSMEEALKYLDSISVHNINVPSDVNGMRDLCNPKYMMPFNIMLLLHRMRRQ